MDSPVVVTGAAGFIGSHISERLLKTGRRVVGLDNFNPNYAEEIKQFNLAFLEEFDGFEFHTADIEDETVVYPIIKEHEPAFLIHCAARSGVRSRVKEPRRYTETNVLGSQTLLDAVRLYSPETKTILFSTSSIYGLQEELPFREDMTVNPQSPYALTKKMMEEVGYLYHDFYDLPVAAVRPFNVYGPRGRPNMAPFLMILAAETGQPFTKFGTNENNKRDWTYIDDFVDGIEFVMEQNDYENFEIYNIGRGEPVGIDMFVETMKQLIEKYLGLTLEIEEAPRGPEELPVTYASIQKAREKLGYDPETSLPTGLEKLFEFYLKNRHVYTNLFVNGIKVK